MALIVADRVQETSTTTGADAYILLGAITGYRTAASVCTNGDTFTYYAEDVDDLGRPTGAWETGLGTWGTGNILTRTTIYASSNAGAAVSWGPGTRKIGLGLVSKAALGPTSITGALAATGNVTGANLSGTNTGDNAINTLYSGLVSNAAHTGEVTGSTALTITNGAVTLAKMANVATGTVFYRKTAATGVPEVQTLATLKTDLGLTGTNSGDQTLPTALPTPNTVTFTTSGGAGAGTTFNGSVARTIDYSTIGAAAAGHTHSYQAADNDLLAIGGLTGTSGLLRKTAADTWTLDTAAYSTTTGTVTSVATSGAITGGTITNAGTIGHSTADGNLHVPATSTTNNGKVLTAGATAGSLSWATPKVGTVTSVTAGNGMTQTGTSTINPTLNIVSHAGTAGTIGTINIGADAIGVNLGTTSTTAARGDHTHAYLSVESDTLATVTGRGSTTTTNLTINNGSPTIFFRDTDQNSAMLHNNSNLFYILRGANNSVTWTQVGSYWPVYWDLTNNNATFGGAIWAAGNITAYSDIKLKENIKTVDGALSKVTQLRGVYYTLKRDETKTRKIGVIAQEIQQVLPEVVLLHRDNEDTEGTLSVDYGNITAVLIEAIKEQQAIIDSQESRIARLEALVNKLVD